MPVPTADYIAGMRRLAAGVTIVTTGLGELRAGPDRDLGLLAHGRAAAAAGLRAPRCRRARHDPRTAGVFAVNVLAPSQRRSWPTISAAATTAPALDRFVARAMGARQHRRPGAGRCRGHLRMRAGRSGGREHAHSILIGEVEAARYDEGASAPGLPRPHLPPAARLAGQSHGRSERAREPSQASTACLRSTPHR